MQIGELMLITGNQQLPIASILAQISYHGLLTNKNLFPEAQQKSNIVLLQLFLLKFYGLSLFYQNYIFPFSHQSCTLIILVLSFSVSIMLCIQRQHFELDLHFVRDHICKGTSNLLHLPAHFQVVDPLTKPVSGNLFLNVRDKFMVIPNPTMSLTGGVNYRVISSL